MGFASKMHAASNHFFPLSGHHPGRGLPGSLHQSCPTSTPRFIRQRSWLSKGMLPLVTLHLLHSSYTGDEIHTLPPLPTGQHDLGPARPGTAPHPFPPTLHSTLQPCPLRSLNKPRGQPSGLGLAGPSVIPRLCSWPAPLNLLALAQGISHRAASPTPAQGLTILSPILFPSQHVPQLGIILCAVCWPMRCKFYKGNSLNYLGHHHVPQPAGGYGYMGEWLAGWRGGWRAG